MLLAGELQAGQLQGAVQPHRALQLAGLGKALFEVDVGQGLQQAGELVLFPFLLQLLAVVVAPADPGLQLPLMMAEPALELRPDLGKGGCAVDTGLGDMGQLTAEGVSCGRRLGRTKRWK